MDEFKVETQPEEPDCTGSTEAACYINVGKIERSEKDYGGGSGRSSFRSELFDVTIWRLTAGTRTTITIKATYEDMHFDGEVDFLSDEACFEQMTFAEVINMIRSVKEEAFDKGRMSKLNELRSVFEI